MRWGSGVRWVARLQETDLITVDNITKTIPSDEHPPSALRGVKFDIPSGAIFGLLGPAGAGKSTLLRLLGLREAPEAGTVLVDELDAGELSGRRLRDLRGQFALVDSFGLRAERTVAGNVALPLERLGLDGAARRARVAELLDLVGLTRAAISSPGELNEGQRRRVVLARALATQPSVLLLDEPTLGLDAEQAGGVLAAIDRARAELGITVVLATREADVVRKVCDGVALFADGRLLEAGTVLSLLTDQTSYTAHALLPAVSSTSQVVRDYDAVADVLLVGHATVETLLPAAEDRNEVQIATISGGKTRVVETPVARYRIGVRGSNAEQALAWIREHGGLVSAQASAPASVRARRAVVEQLLQAA
jgi:D-methionine transport system ATP-binding protein